MAEVKDSDFEAFVSSLKNKLMKVSDYAKMKGVSTTWIYSLERKGKIRTMSISGVKFVILDDDDHE